MKSVHGHLHRPGRLRPRLPRSFKDLTPTKAFNPRTFFYEMVWKVLLTRRKGNNKRPVFPKLTPGQVALTWIGHASFLIQFHNLNVLVDPNFANWLFLLKRLKRAGLTIKHLPPIDLVLLTHAHFDHFHKPTLRRLPHPKIAVMPWGMSDLAYGLSAVGSVAEPAQARTALRQALAIVEALAAADKLTPAQRNCSVCAWMDLVRQCGFPPTQVGSVTTLRIIW